MRSQSITTALAHGFGFRQWLTPHAAQVTGGGDGSSAPHAEQKRTAGIGEGYFDERDEFHVLRSDP
jgi:hypothetical protein